MAYLKVLTDKDIREIIARSNEIEKNNLISIYKNDWKGVRISCNKNI